MEEKNLIPMIFVNENFGKVRVLGDWENPRFCLADVCKVLDLNPSKIAQRLEKGVLSKYTLQTAGGIQEMNFVNESGLYDVVFDSRKPQARQFRKWVTEEVLPTIRKTGKYETAGKKEPQLEKESTLERVLGEVSRIIEMVDMSATEQLTLFHVILKVHRNNWKPVPISVKKMSANMMRDHRTTEKALKNLETAGYIKSANKNYALNF